MFKEGGHCCFRPPFFLVLSCPFGHKREPQTRVGLVTSSLPRKRSTTELLRLFVFSLSLLRIPLLSAGCGVSAASPLSWSGRRGSNPPPIAWKAIALPNELLPRVKFGFVGEGGLEPPNSSEDRFTVCCNCRYATPPICLCPFAQLNWVPDPEPMKGLEPPTG